MDALDPKLAIRHSKSFTLIELLVVVAIIAVLIAILLPALSAANAQAKSLVCQSQMRQFGMAFVLYARDFGTWPSKGVCTGSFRTYSWVPSGNPQGYPPSPLFDVANGALFPYVRRREMYVCPAHRAQNPKAKLSYSQNCVLFSIAGDFPNPDVVQYPAELINLVDQGWANDGYFVIGLVGELTTNYTAWYHPGPSTNFLMVDGHVDDFRLDNAKLFRGYTWPYRLPWDER